MIEKAKILLTTTNMTIEKISKELGYSNGLGIIRLFKKYEGITPEAYQNSNKKNKIFEGGFYEH